MPAPPSIAEIGHLWRLDAASGLPDEIAGKVRAQQVDAVSRLTALLMVVNIVNTTVLVGVLYAVGGLTWPALGWAVTLKVLALWSLIRTAQRRRETPPATASLRTIRRIVRSGAVFGLLWALPGLLILPALTGIAQVLCAFVLIGMAAGGAIALYPVPAAASAFFVLCTIGGLAGLIRAEATPPVAVAVLVMGGLFFLVFAQVIRRHSETFVAEFVGRLELQKRNRLIAQLLDEAQREAHGEKRRSEERIAQAKKMEAIGQLTGGIAHDFNNLLAAIQGHAELIALEEKADPSLVTPITSATARGADLIQRLLSVARKQVLRPRAVDVPRLMEDLVVLLRRTLGPQIAVETDIAADAWPVLADPGQLEGALLNLAVNARDAMPGGGTLTLMVGNLPPHSARIRMAGLDGGGFVEITVRDTGTGMDAEVRERAFDPFYTTKKFGLGSGLGLATVAGFAEQSGGRVQIDSAPGQGTAISIFLPRAEVKPVPQPEAVPGADEAEAGAGETILLVEDTDDVRAVTERMLRGLGYRVRSVATAREALDALSEDGPLDLVLTDILLPGGMTGFELAGAMSELAPAVPVAFVSGFNHGDGPGAAILGKPFQRRELALHVRRALDRAPIAGAKAMRRVRASSD